MKKTLLASSLFCAFTSIACAQSSVTLYGVVDAGLSYTHRGNSFDKVMDYNSFGLAYGMQSGNRFGLKGVEDLGQGNRLTFQLENGFDLGNGTLEQDKRLFGRQAWFGVENDSWGYARIGRQYNFATDYFGAIDPFNLGFGQASMGSAFGTTDMYRMSNAIKYQSPVMSGFQFGAGYSFANGESAKYWNPGSNTYTNGTTGYNYVTSNNNRQITLGAKYASGPLYIAASFDKVYGANSSLNDSGADPYAWNIGASYDFNVVKLAVAYGQTRDGVISGEGDGMTGPSSPYWEGGTGVVGFDSRRKSNSILAGLTVPINAGSRAFASWTYKMNEQDLGGLTLASNNQSAYSLGYAYDFTKRTNMYAFVSYMNNVNGSETTKTTVGLGMRHQF